MIDLSIIIPVYNAENYIERCVNSIIDSYKLSSNLNIEIITINDGSSDSSLNIINELKTKNPFVKVISHENKGVSISRNVALEKVKGNYIWMIDADDYIHVKSLKYLESFIKESNYEIINFGYFQEIKKGLFHDRILIQKESQTCIDGISYLEKNYGGLYLWNNIYKTAFLKNNNIRFSDQLSSLEDGLFNVYAFSNAKKVLLIGESFYYYCINPKSITRNNDLNNLINKSKDSQYFHLEIFHFLKLVEKKKLKKHYIIKLQLYHSILGYFYSMMILKYPIEHIKASLKKYKELGLYPIPYSRKLNRKAFLFSLLFNNEYLYLFFCKLNSLRK